MNDLWRLSAVDLAALIRGRKVSAKEAASAGLARLDAVNPAINAVVEHHPEDVMAQAAAVDAAMARGDEVGPLGGVPVTVKVNIDYAGYATTNGLNIQRDVLPTSNSPVIDNLRKAGAVILGRTNCPAFSYRWFTTNLLYGDTKNPRDPALTPGGSSGGAASSVAAGIGHIAHGTDIAGSIRYPAYACGVHGLRPTLGRIAAYNAALPERIISGQITAMSGPLARTIGDIRLGLHVMSQPDMRDPWWVPAPLEGPAMPKRAAMCLRPDGLEISADVEAAVRDAGKRLEAAGWTVEEIDNTPALREAAELQTTIWFGDGFQGMLDAAEREGDPGALACLRGNKRKLEGFENGGLSRALVRRSTFVRDWQMFLQTYAVVLMPVSGELPFEDNLDLKDDQSFERVWRAQMPQIGIPFMGLPALSVATGLVGRVPTGVQIVAGRYREDLCMLAGEAIEAGGTPVSPIDPVTA
ncbi:MAG: amidase [Tardiphaga sp.]|uniref:amidase family protein n=1 Tax=Tardiphaga sp. TaxID=1926292 RepID=UPI002619E2E8|nr:amidase family protein [Tardiphaga sp.]MDB5500817.1 amidase [Tardiphaga sp.]